MIIKYHHLWKILPGLTFFLFLACDLLPTSETDTSLYVRFENSPQSEFVIWNIQLMAMGKSGTQTAAPAGEWSDNILTDGETIAPGAHLFFTLDIPNLHYSSCRIGVIDTNGASLLLHEQEGYTEEEMTGQITHWGSDERTVDVTVLRDNTTGRIIITGYSDFAGIE